MATTLRSEQRVEKPGETAPRTRARGHLSLVEWNGEAETSEPMTSKRTALVRRTGADRLYTGGVLLLMAATALAVVASFVRL